MTWFCVATFFLFCPRPVWRATVLKPVPGSGSRAKCAQFRGSSDAKHVSSWFQPWATLWPTCHMLVPTSLLQSVECSTECKNSIFHCTIGFNKYKSSLASGASPQTPPGGLFLPPGPPPPAWVHAAHRHGMVSPRKVWFQRPCSGSRGGCGTGFRTLACRHCQTFYTFYLVQPFCKVVI